jgi:hypothetical protein
MNSSETKGTTMNPTDAPRYIIPADTESLPHLTARLNEAVSAGDAHAADRAIRCARNRGDHAEAERITAAFYAARPDLTRPPVSA